ncbi:CorA family divalent cation transporter [Loktanella sp. DJP18]|uniref:CorA family divalent cation transporter n=1 Tax=Loktanella sp. DJP18 TaxID=3409788 RepID=UPI003BB7C681
MSTHNEDSTLTPLSAFDIWADGTARPASDETVRPATGAAYRWLHFDLSDVGLAGWSTRNLPGLARRTLLADKTRPRMDLDDHGMSITLRGINMNAGEETADMVSLRIWMAHDLIITVRRQRIFALEELRGQVVTGDAPRSPGHMLARITEGLVERLENIAFAREDTADDMEIDVYEHDRAPLDDLAPLRREIIKFRRHVAPLAEALTQVAQSRTDLIKDDLRHRLRDTASRCRWALEELSEVHDRLTAMADHLDAVQNARLEKNGYRLSIVAAIFLPLGFLTGLFGVNVGGMPGVDHPYAFFWLTVGMAAIGVLSAAIMRWLRWF